MSKANSLIITDFLYEEAKPFEYIITGGEPGKNMESTLAISSYLANKGRSYSLNSNLTLMNERNLGRLLESNPRLGILTSLPHFEEETFQRITGKNTLKEFYKNLKLVKSKNIPITVNMVVNQLNKDEVYAEGKFLFENYGIKSFCATPMLRPSIRGVGNTLSNQEIIGVLENLVKLNEDFGIKGESLEVIPYCLLPETMRNEDTFIRGCTAGRSSIQVGYNGDIRPCGHSPLSYGNLLEEEFKTIWKRLEPFRKNEYVPIECKECAEVQDCKGGCRFEGFVEGDSLDKKDSRMIGKLSERRKISMPEVDLDKTYKARLELYRQETPNSFALYNGKVILANTELKDFILGVQKNNGIRFREIPEENGLRDKAVGLAKILIKTKFLEKQ
jgi:radical SAM protein with 4Fe4S-binding SPASM domain